MLKIDYFRTRFAEFAIQQIKTQGGKAPVIRRQIGDFIEYEVLASPIDRKVGKTSFWTDTSGTVTETTYLGVIPVSVINRPCDDDGC